LLLAAACAAATPARAQDRLPAQVTLSAAELFAFADAARDRGDYAAAETAYRALIQDPDLELRTEARFRLARMYAGPMDRKREAAVLLRRILDDKPDAAPVRLELARVLAELGEYQSARRELRAAQAGGLPPEVEQLVRFYANALGATKLLGGSVDLAVAPSTNINRATSSDTLGTVIGDFVLDEDAQARSGVGLSLKGQGYARLPVSAKTDILLRANAAADIYRQSRFDDMSVSLQAGPQWRWGSDRLALSAATSWRWYGLDPYSVSYGLTGNWQHPLSGRNQLRIDATALKEDNRRNDLQDGERYTLAVGIDHALSSRAGGGVQLHGSRDAARDPGYSTASGGVGGYVYRELGRTTAVLNASYRRLEADARLFLYPERRKDDNVSLSLSGTFRSLTIGTLAPVARVRYERNWSSVEIYDFERLTGEVGIAAAF
jgi:outer membrane protein